MEFLLELALALALFCSTTSGIPRYPNPPQTPLQQIDTMSLSLPTNTTLSITQCAIDVFLACRKNDGLIDGLTYWQVANGYTAIALHDTWSNTTTYSTVLEDLVGKVSSDHENCINGWNDDSMWWAIASLELSDLDHDPNHVTMAWTIWEHVDRYVIPQGKYIFNGIDMEGSVMWTSRTNETQVNVITTALYAELSARLATLTTNKQNTAIFLTAAITSLSWILRAMYEPSTFLVYDHIELLSGEVFNWTFTYNTGQTIAAALAISTALLHQHTQLDPIQSQQATSYLDLACTLANHSLTNPSWISPEGILTDPSAYPGTGPVPIQPSQNNDGIGFKSILLRNLAKLFRVLRTTTTHNEIQTQLSTFITNQYLSLQTNDTNEKCQYGPWWAGPMDLPSSHSQLAALDVMAAIHAIENSPT